MVTAKDKTTQRVHVKVTHQNVVDFCLGLGPETLWEYQKEIRSKPQVEGKRGRYEEEIEGLLSAEEVLENIKEEFHKREGKTLEAWHKARERAKRKKERRKKKKRKKKNKRSKKVVGKW